MEFEWDPAKQAANLRKHGLLFEEAAEVFEGEYFSNQDVRKKYGEDRFQCLGVSAGRIVVVVYTKRGNKYRIISLRKANEREKKSYKKRLGSR